MAGFTRVTPIKTNVSSLSAGCWVLLPSRVAGARCGTARLFCWSCKALTEAARRKQKESRCRRAIPAQMPSRGEGAAHRPHLPTIIPQGAALETQRGCVSSLLRGPPNQVLLFVSLRLFQGPHQLEGIALPVQSAAAWKMARNAESQAHSRSSQGRTCTWTRYPVTGTNSEG